MVTSLIHKIWELLTKTNLINVETLIRKIVKDTRSYLFITKFHIKVSASDSLMLLLVSLGIELKDCTSVPRVPRKKRLIIMSKKYNENS